MVDQHKERLALEAAEGSGSKKKKKKKKKKRKHDEVDSDDEEAVRKKKIKDAIKQQEREDEAAAKLIATDERSREYGALSGAGDKATEEEMEAFRLRQSRADDPMSQFDQFK